jgi:phosphatidylglycerol:prolipoprotein diacylglycerol transferase
MRPLAGRNSTEWSVVLAAISYPTVVKVHIGPLAISPHGVGIAVGFLLGARLLIPEAERKGIPEESVYPLLIRAFIGALIGARLAYVINHLSDYNSPLDILKVWQGGISLLGGFIGAVIAVLPSIRKSGISFWRIMDAAAPGMALGVIVGRVGDLIVGDHLGKTTSLPFGFKCPTDVTSTASPCLPGPGSVVHQTALYDLVLTCALLGVLLWLRRHKPRYDGFLIMLFAAWYGCQRILEDFLREDKHIIGTAARGLTGSQVTSIIFVLVCVFHMVFVRKTPRWGRWDQRVVAPETEAEPAAATDPEAAGDERVPAPVPAAPAVAAEAEAAPAPQAEAAPQAEVAQAAPAAGEAEPEGEPVAVAEESAPEEAAREEPTPEAVVLESPEPPAPVAEPVETDSPEPATTMPVTPRDPVSPPGAQHSDEE